MLAPVPLVDFAPDLATPTPGVIVDTEIAGITSNDSLGFIPANNGFGNLPGHVTVGTGALAAAVQGAAVVLLTNGSYRVLAGTTAAIYELEGITVTDRSRGGGYTSGANRWRFASYGDNVYATNKADIIQKSTGAAFANIVTIPKCTFMDRVGDFLIIAGTNETIYGDQPDRWWCSALGNPDDFITAISTQCATNRLTDSPGPITASKSLGDDWILYKKNAVYRGVYQGPPNVWEFQRVSDDVGTLSNESIVKVGYSHFFVGPDDFYRFDGAVPIPLPNNVKTWFFNRLQKDYAYKIQGFYDRYSSIIYWFYPGPIYGTAAVGDLTHFIAVNLKSGKWGAGRCRIESIVDYYTGGMTYDAFYPPTGSTTWNALPAITYDSLLFVGGSPVMAAFDVSHILGTFSGQDSASSTYEVGIQMTLADVGSDLTFSSLVQVIPRFLTLPTLETDPFAAQIACRFFYAGRDVMGQSITFDASDYGVVQSNGRAYVPMDSHRWHRLGTSVRGTAAVLSQINYDVEEDGEE